MGGFRRYINTFIIIIIKPVVLSLYCFNLSFAIASTVENCSESKHIKSKKKSEIEKSVELAIYSNLTCATINLTQSKHRKVH